MSRDEVAVMNGSKCILQLRGVEKYLNRRMKVKAEDKYEVIQV